MRAVLAIFSIGAAALALRDVGIVRFKMPERHGQVKRETTLSHPILGLLMHGFALGTAFYTFIPVGLTYLIFAIPFSIPVYADVVVLAFAFALGRSLPVYMRMFFRNLDAEVLAKKLMTRGLPLARTISALSLCGVAGMLAGNVARSMMS